MSLSNIYEGWRNKIIPPEKLKEIIKKTGEKRLDICRKCDQHSSNKEGYSSIRFDEHCTNCGCTLSAKVSCLNCECPLKYWGAELTGEQLKEITNGK